MPELPEVETTLRGIEPLINGCTLVDVCAYAPKLRWLVPERDLAGLVGQSIIGMSRRSKYMLWDMEGGQTVVVHLGMSGRMTIAELGAPAEKYEHVQFDFEQPDAAGGVSIRLRDPRKFGAVLVIPTVELEAHKLFSSLGPEPLTDVFDAAYLGEKLTRRKMAIKPALMDAKLVVGVGNIYANEALWRTGITPERACNKVKKSELAPLVGHIKDVLVEAIAAGGSTLKDFAQADGKLGYFHKDFAVYDRAGEPCLRCGHDLVKVSLGGRGTYYCTGCQK